MAERELSPETSVPAPAESAARAPVTVAPVARGGLSVAAVQELQRTAGNAAVARLVASQGAGAPVPPELGAGFAQRVHGLVAKQAPAGDDGAAPPAGSTGAAPAAATAAEVDRAEVDAKRAELETALPTPPAPEPIQTASPVPATPPAALPGQAATAGGGQHSGEAKTAASAAAQASALADRAVEVADAPAAPGPAPEVVAPSITPPVDAGGAPLPPAPGDDARIAALAAQIQALRTEGQNLQGQASGASANATKLRGMLHGAEAQVAAGEGVVSEWSGHNAYRREVVGQAKAALQASESKAAVVAEKAPEIQAKAAEHKQETGPATAEAKSLGGQSSSASPDDAEAAGKSKEQGKQLGQAGDGLQSVDGAFTQTDAKAGGLAAEAAEAKTSNASTAAKIGETEASLAQSDAKLTELGAQNTQARAQLQTFAGKPDEIEAKAREIDTHGGGLVAGSLELERRLHAAQQSYLGGMAAIPPLPPPRARGRGGTLARSPLEGRYDDRERAGLDTKLAGALPTWATDPLADDEPDANARRQAMLAEQARRQRDIAAIEAETGGHFEKLSAGRKVGIALGLVWDHAVQGAGDVKFPKLLGHLALGLVHPGISLMGVVSGFSMMVSGFMNLFSAKQWSNDPLGNLLKSAADIATGLTIVFASIMGLAVAITAIMWGLAIITAGALGPAAAFVTTIAGQVLSFLTPLTIKCGLWAMALQAAVFIKNLIDAATAKSAADLQNQSDQMTEDAKNFGTMAVTVGTIAAAEAAGGALKGTKVGNYVGGRVQALGEWAKIYPPGGVGAGAAGGAAGDTAAGAAGGGDAAPPVAASDSAAAPGATDAPPASAPGATDASPASAADAAAGAPDAAPASDAAPKAADTSPAGDAKTTDPASPSDATPADAGDGAEPAPAKPKMTAKARKLNTRLNYLEELYEPTLRQYHDAPKMLDRIERIRGMLEEGRVGEAQVEIDRLEGDLKDIDDLMGHLIKETGGGRASELVDPDEIPTQPREGKLENVEGLRKRPELPPEGSPTRPPRRFQENFHSEANRAAQQKILDRANAGEAKEVGLDYQDLVAHDLNGEDVQELFERPGRRMDIGPHHEVTLEGRNGPFGEGKLDQFWLDMVDTGQLMLTVPKLSPEAASQLARLIAQAEQLLGKPPLVIVRETAANL